MEEFCPGCSTKYFLQLYVAQVDKVALFGYSSSYVLRFSLVNALSVVVQSGP